jgi:hypothetical protein
MSKNHYSKPSHWSDNDYHRPDNDCQKPGPPPDNDCKPYSQPSPEPVCDPSDPPSNDHHAALVSANVDADIGVASLLNVDAEVCASVLDGHSLVHLDADIDVGLGLWHA